MSAEDSIRALLAGLETSDPADWRRKSARIAWVKDTVAALRAAQQKVDEAWDRMLEALPDHLGEEELDALNLPDPPEQAEVDALHAQIRAVIDHDRWPRELYFGDL
jgi:hypothetical protein